MINRRKFLQSVGLGASLVSLPALGASEKKHDLGDIPDLEYFKNKITTSTKIPDKYFTNGITFLDLGGITTSVIPERFDIPSLAANEIEIDSPHGHEYVLEKYIWNPINIKLNFDNDDVFDKRLKEVIWLHILSNDEFERNNKFNTAKFDILYWLNNDRYIIKDAMIESSRIDTAAKCNLMDAEYIDMKISYYTSFLYPENT